MPAAEDDKAEKDRKLGERELEDEDSTISYEQYLAQLKETTTPTVPKLEGIREANEGADGPWDDVVEHKKNEDEQAYFVGKV
jgi:plasminogen activator inhibitor 1 RNA-binding protein